MRNPIIHESEGHKAILAHEKIRSQTVIKETNPFGATKKRSNNYEKLYHSLIAIKHTSVEPDWAFSAMGPFVTTQTD